METREIKFRGINKVNNQFVHGYYNAQPSKGFHYIYTDHTTYPVKPETVGQFTGLTDKNGKRDELLEALREIKNAEHGTYKGTSTYLKKVASDAIDKALKLSNNDT